MNQHVRQPRGSSLPASCPPRGLRREGAADYVGISPSKFDEMVGDGRMPKPRRIDHAKVWDRLELDLYFDALPKDNPALKPNSWDDR